MVTAGNKKGKINTKWYNVIRAGLSTQRSTMRIIDISFTETTFRTLRFQSGTARFELPFVTAVMGSEPPWCSCSKFLEWPRCQSMFFKWTKPEILPLNFALIQLDSNSDLRRVGRWRWPLEPPPRPCFLFHRVADTRHKKLGALPPKNSSHSPNSHLFSSLKIPIVKINEFSEMEWKLRSFIKIG